MGPLYRRGGISLQKNVGLVTDTVSQNFNQYHTWSCRPADARLSERLAVESIRGFNESISGTNQGFHYEIN